MAGWEGCDSGPGVVDWLASADSWLGERRGVVSDILAVVVDMGFIWGVFEVV